MDDVVTLTDFKYSYVSSSRNDQLRLLESVHTYPNRFDLETREYADYLWSKRYEIYSLVDTNIDNVLGDPKYRNKQYNHSLHIRPTGFKIYDAIGDEIAQGIYDYQEPLKLVQIYYIEFILPPKKCRATSLVNDLFRYKFSDDIKVRYL